jgi:hypothetical protein
MPGVWAGGDCVAGGEDLTVAAVEDGKIAAESIHRALAGGELDERDSHSLGAEPAPGGRVEIAQRFRGGGWATGYLPPSRNSPSLRSPNFDLPSRGRFGPHG